MKFSPVGSEVKLAVHPTLKSVADLLLVFEQIILLDFEFKSVDGERPVTRCLVARVLPSGDLIRLRRDEMGTEPPYRTDEKVLAVAFVASAEMGCHRELGWPMFKRVLDLHAEH